MTVRIAHHRKVSHDTAYVHRWLNQSVLLTCQLSNPINFFTAVALETEVIQTGFHFILDDDQDEDWIFSRRRCRAEPDIMTAFKPAITHDRETTEGSVEVDRSVKIARVDCDVSPASWHASKSDLARILHLAMTVQRWLFLVASAERTNSVAVGNAHGSRIRTYHSDPERVE